MNRALGRPTVDRVVKRYKKTQAPKAAIEAGNRYRVERVQAVSSHACKGCGGLIVPGFPYLRIQDLHRMRRMGNLMITEKMPYHAGCEPREARQAVDLLFPEHQK